MRLDSLSFFFNATAPTEIYTLSLHDALPISFLPTARSSKARRPSTRARSRENRRPSFANRAAISPRSPAVRSEEHTSELQSHVNLVCRLLLEKKKKNNTLNN